MPRPRVAALALSARTLLAPALLAPLLALGCVGPAKSAAYEPPDERFVLFTSASSEVTNSDGFFALGYVVAMLEEHPRYRALIVGHADTTGPSDRNRDLCFKRARAVRKVLLSHGVSEARIQLAAPKVIDATSNPMLSRRADVYLFDPALEDVAKRLGYDVEIRGD